MTNTQAPYEVGTTFSTYSGLGGHSLATVVDNTNGVVSYTFPGSPEVHMSYVSVLDEAQDPALLKSGNAIEMRRAF